MALLNANYVFPELPILHSSSELQGADAAMSDESLNRHHPSLIVRDGVPNATGRGASVGVDLNVDCATQQGAVLAVRACRIFLRPLRPIARPAKLAVNSGHGFGERLRLADGSQTPSPADHLGAPQARDSKAKVDRSRHGRHSRELHPGRRAMVRGGAHRGAQDHQEGQTLSGQVAGLFVAAGHVGARDALLAPRPSRYEPAHLACPRVRPVTLSRRKRRCVQTNTSVSAQRSPRRRRQHARCAEAAPAWCVHFRSMSCGCSRESCRRLSGGLHMKPLPVYTPPPLVDSCRLAASVLDAVLTQKLASGLPGCYTTN